MKKWLALIALGWGCESGMYVGERLPPDSGAPSGDAGDTSSTPRSCCTVGSVVGLGADGEQGSPPAVAWDGRAWRVAWQDFTSAHLRLATIDGPTGGLVSQVPTSTKLLPYGAVWESGRLTLVGDTAALPRKGTPAPALMAVSADGVVERTSPIEGAWQRGSLTAWTSQNLLVFAGIGTSSPEATVNSQVAFFRTDDYAPVVASTQLSLSLDEVAVASWNQGIGRVRSRNGSLELDAFDKQVLRPLPASPTAEDLDRVRTFALVPGYSSAFAASELEGRLFVAAATQGAVLLWVVDFSTGRVTGPAKVATTDQFGLPDAPGLAADPINGTVALCYLDQDVASTHSWVKVALLDRTGHVLGEPTTAIPAVKRARTCTVTAGAPGDFLVTSWIAEAPARAPVRTVKVVSR